MQKRKRSGEAAAAAAVGWKGREGFILQRAAKINILYVQSTDTEYPYPYVCNYVLLILLYIILHTYVFNLYLKS